MTRVICGWRGRVFIGLWIRRKFIWDKANLEVGQGILLDLGDFLRNLWGLGFFIKRRIKFFEKRRI